MHADPTEAAISAIKRMACSPDNVARVLSVLANHYGDWLSAHDLIGNPKAPEESGYGKTLDAYNEVDDYADWLAAAQQRVA